MTATMNKVYIWMLLHSILLSIAPHVHAQGLQIGQSMPDITLTQLLNSDDQSISLKKLKGKNIILYSWAVYCAPCIKKFPELNRLRDEYRDDLEIILISGDSYDRIKRIFERQQELGKNITLTQAILTEDEIEAFALTEEDGYGGSIWIDKNGVYQGSAEINKDNVYHFISQGKPKKLKFFNYAKAVKDFEPVNEAERLENFRKLKDYDREKPLLFAQKQKGIRSGSVFTAYNPAFPDKAPMVIVMKDNKPIGIRLVNVYHSFLYSLANTVELEVDTATGVITPYKKRRVEKAVVKPESKEKLNGVNVFNGDSLLVAKGVCYELILPEDSQSDISTLLTYMRNDVDQYFGFSSTIEKKKCLALVRLGDKDFRSTSAIRKLSRDNYGVVIRKGPMDYLATAIFYYLKLSENKYPYVLNHTGIESDVDIDLVAEMTDLTSIKAALNNIGLDLVETGPIGEVCIVTDH